MFRLSALRRVCQIVAVLLLCQTALDLSYASLCSLDSDEGASIAALTAISHRTTTLTTDKQSQPSSPAMDDCFCCSAYVEPQGIAQFIPVTIVSRAEAAIAVRHVPLVPSTFFHPPQLLS